ncbi:uncharacterized protein LOC144702890 [Wolffia australiana]
MLQRFVDHVLAITKESVKTLTYESVNNIVRLINGISAFLLAFIPGKTPILEGIHGWELRPTLRGPRLPRWMDNGVSSFNQFIHDLSLEFEPPDADYMSGDETYYDEDSLPASPLSQSSRLSRASSFSRYDRSRWRKIRRMISFVFWAIKFFFLLPLVVFRSLGFGRAEVRSSDISSEQSPSSLRRERSANVKDHIVHRATDRRRGVVEDLQLGIEIFIEGLFQFFHKAAYFILSPREAFLTVLGWWTGHEERDGQFMGDVDTSVPSATLASAEPGLTERQSSLHHSMNTDARTCEDVIREHGYPYESYKVVTSDGYILLLERIPRRDSQKVVYLQHGILDSSMGWVSNGVVGSPAFAAFDQGFDVFLGNFRGLVSKEHIDKNISSRKYWNYSVNEHGTEDVPAIVSEIDRVKRSELADQQYKLCGVSHSLGGAAMIMYVVTQRMTGRPHHLSRLILLSPAGFHADSTVVFTFMEYLVLFLGPLLAYFIPALYIPTRFFRLLMNKLARDFHNYPALGGLVQTLMGSVAGGDASNWIGALGLPHYNVYDMPGMSLHVCIHLAQMKRSGKFAMYDYGTAAANMASYGSPRPPDLGELYHLIDVPVDLVAGRKDQVIRASMVRKHYRMMIKAGIEVTLNEYEYAHLDFTFSHREELLAYVMSRLVLVAPVQGRRGYRGSSTKQKKGNGDTAKDDEVVDIVPDRPGRGRWTGRPE